MQWATPHHRQDMQLLAGPSALVVLRNEAQA